MDKPFRDADQLIELLENRNLIIEDKQLAGKLLISNTYYNTVNSYGYLLLDDSGSYNNATFKELFTIYTLDNEIKHVFFKYLLIIENYFKSILVYEFSKEYQNEGNFYLNMENYNINTKNKVKSVNKVINTVSKIIKKNENSNPIRHYQKKYDNLPLWVLIKKIDFGTSYQMCKNSTLKIQNNICRSFFDSVNENRYRLTSLQLNNYIKCFKEIRNICAHADRLIDHKLQISVKNYENIRDEFSFSNNKNTVYDIFIISKIFLSKEQYDIFTKTIRKRFNNFEKKLCHCSINQILNCYGFPNDWNKNI